VIPAPPIPAFAGEFVPNQHRVQRLRVWHGKQGDMALVSHLDLVRLFERAVRRAALPIAFTGGFHPNPRISPASALSLGTTSSGEIVDFELTEAMEVDEFHRRLAAQLPLDIPIYRVEAIAVDTPSATQLLDRADYTIALSPVLDDESVSALTEADWQAWIDAVKTTEVIEWEQTSKSGKKRMVNLRDRLFLLEWLTLSQMPHELASLATTTPTAVLHYVGSCRNDGTLLRPEHLIYMLEHVSQRQFQLRHSHRNHLLLETT
jgi:radical SAM-linked protein